MEFVGVQAKIEENNKRDIQKEVENSQQEPQFHISIHWLRIGE